MISQINKLNFTALLTPISRKEPTGKNLRENETLLPLYHQIKDARMAARTVERQQIQGAEKSVKPDWQVVYSAAINILTTQSKDLEVTAWLIEALLREEGFSGLCAGFRLTRQLCEKFWGKLYPLPDEDGLFSLIAPLTGLNGEEVEGSLIAPIALTPLTQGDSVGPFALWQYRQALELLKISDPDKRAQRIAAGGVSLEMIERALTESSVDFLDTQRQVLRACIEEYALLTALLKQKCAEDAPPSSRILTQLHACLECINCHNPPSEDNAAETAPILDDNSQTTTHAGEIMLPRTTKTSSSREEILNNLLQAAEFFRSTEPHSPVSYLLERTVRWAKTPLPELLKELIQDETARGQLGHLTGIEFMK